MLNKLLQDSNLGKALLCHLRKQIKANYIQGVNILNTKNKKLLAIIRDLEYNIIIKFRVVIHA